jgi:hypothetical protein
MASGESFYRRMDVKVPCGFIDLLREAVLRERGAGRDAIVVALREQEKFEYERLRGAKGAQRRAVFWNLKRIDAFLASIGADESPELIALGRAIRDARERKRLTPERLAERTGLDEDYMLALEAGRCNVPYELLFDLADALGVAPGTIVRKAVRRR